MTTLLDFLPDVGGATLAANGGPRVPAVSPPAARAPLAGPLTRGPAGGAPRVLGLDLSLTGTGVAGPGWADTIKSRARRKHERRVDFIHWRFGFIAESLRTYLSGVELAVMENLAVGPGMDMDRQLAGLAWLVRDMLYRHEIPYALVSTGQLKRYAIGKGKRTGKEIAADAANGRTAKTPVVQAVTGWFGWFDGDDNAADALVLAAMGADHLGRPLVTVPAHNRAVLEAVAWPEALYA